MNPDQNKFSLMILPGNGCKDISTSLWYSWLAQNLRKKYPIANIICENFPDPYEAKDENWTPFVKSHLDSTEPTLRYVVGHSSGCVCSMRLMESYQLKAAFLVAGCVTHLDTDSELISGYYIDQPGTDKKRPWLWNEMRKNSSYIVHFGSQDDPYIPFEEMLEIKKGLNLSDSDFISYDKSCSKGHFQSSSFSELYDEIVKRIDLDFQV